MKSTVALALAALFASTAAHAADLSVISFGGTNQKAQEKAYYQPWQKASGNKIVAGEYNGEQAKIKAMVEAGKVSWDVVEVESPELVRGCEEGLYEKLDYSKIAPKGDFVPGTATECGLGFFVWSTAMAYNADKVGAKAPTSWADFWDVKTWPGKRGLRKGAKFTLEIALMADGVAPEQVYAQLATKAGVDRAFKKLDQLKANIQWWEAGAQPPQMLASGDVTMAAAFNGRIANAQKEGRNLKIVWAGNIYDVDAWAIPKGSANRELAYSFIKFVAQPENQRVYSGEIPYGPTHAKAVAGIDARIAAELPTAPANLKGALQSNTRFWVDHGEELEQRFNSWAAR
ncbi:ABC transporter substrate-binding protein [Derxia lacustris]|uniref:ABC transporter substrate-binding protein n=1 Tax=Derxia lacustris TaxID=764842 RepID=UPI000A1729FC|nr:ABC transporter substrate-binding protein [Derxia lacustris]